MDGIDGHGPGGDAGTAQHPITAAIGQLAATLVGVRDAAAWQMGDAELGAAVRAAGALVGGVHELLLRLVGEADARDLTGRAGAPTPAAWLRHELNCPPRAAKDAVRVAAGLRAGMAATGAALAVGGLDLAQAAVIVDTVTGLPDLPDGAPAAETAGLAGRVEADLIARAAQFDADQLRRLARHILTVIAPEIGEAVEGAALDAAERRDCAPRALSITPDGAGTWWVRGRLDTEAAATIRAALDPLSAPNPSADGTPDPRTAAARRADALTEVCRRALRAGQVGGHGGQPATVIVHIPLAALTPAARTAAATSPSRTPGQTPGQAAGGTAANTTAGGPGGGTAAAPGHSAGGGLGYLADGTPISPALARKLACDGDLIPAVLGTDGAVLDLGRTHRLFTGATRRALALRDRGCAFPGVRREALVDRVEVRDLRRSSVAAVL